MYKRQAITNELEEHKPLKAKGVVPTYFSTISEAVDFIRISPIEVHEIQPVSYTHLDVYKRQVLEGRLALSKTSTRKYIAMLNCAAKDQRAHGLFQFYGANRLSLIHIYLNREYVF